MSSLHRLIPVRVSLVVVATVFVAFNTLTARFGGVGATDPVVLALLGLYATAVAGDTIRPSGRTPRTAPERPGRIFQAWRKGRAKAER